ncbi:MAG: M20/M25/M40 family metallo-hydrolase, partial [Gammaproteobacteria bacterium]|nr:M20/M25/M40 family metallo-hydrolase [Gammaproteobacteria bacterium]
MPAAPPARLARAAFLGVLAAALAGSAALGAAPAPPAQQASDALAHDILKQLIAINTTDSVGSVTAAAEAMGQRLRAAGFAAADLTLLGPQARKQNLVVRLRGTGAHKAVLLLGHLDVVEAHREDWSTDPFELVEKGGRFYGRGTLDMKGPDAIMVATLIRLRQEGFRPARDIILALTADEEGGCCDGVTWLLANHRPLIDAELVLNQDDYSVILEHGTPQYFQIDASEKVYADYQLSVTSPGGHSSQPVAGNAIYTLTRGLDRLADYHFPFELNAVTREYFSRRARMETGQRAADMRAVLATPPDAQAVARLTADPLESWATHTTCVATWLEAGHANNALPQRAQAVVNCRILPGHTPREIQQVLASVLRDPAIAVRYIASDGEVRDQAPEQQAYAPPPLLPQVMDPLERTVAGIWPKLAVIPYTSPGASDSAHTSAAGLPSYTFS